MTTVGDKSIIATHTLLLADDETAAFDLPLGDTSVPVSVRFTDPDSPDPEGRWQLLDGRLALRFRGWNYPSGNGYRTAHRIADWNGQPIGFKMAHQRLGELNCATLQFYLGGKYE